MTDSSDLSRTGISESDGTGGAGVLWIETDLIADTSVCSVLQWNTEGAGGADDTDTLGK